MKTTRFWKSILVPCVLIAVAISALQEVAAKGFLFRRCAARCCSTANCSSHVQYNQTCHTVPLAEAQSIAGNNQPMIDDFAHSVAVDTILAFDGDRDELARDTDVFSGKLDSARAISDRIAQRYRPDHSQTKGAFWEEVTVQMLSKPGYTKRVRDVPSSLKREVMDNYGLPVDTMSDYEIDHLISLELGGSNDIKNLWPEPYDGKWNARVKDKLENRLHRLVVNGDIELRTAQKEIARDWIAAYKKYMDDEP